MSSLPSPNIFRYQLVSISLISITLFLCCAPCFAEEKLRLASWELLRWVLVPLRDATDCLRCTWCGGCPPPGPTTPPPLLRAASMAQRVSPSLQGQISESKVKRRSFRLASVPLFPFLTDHSSFRDRRMSKESLLCQTLISLLFGLGSAPTLTLFSSLFVISSL